MSMKAKRGAVQFNVCSQSMVCQYFSHAQSFTFVRDQATEKICQKFYTEFHSLKAEIFEIESHLPLQIMLAVRQDCCDEPDSI